MNLIDLANVTLAFSHLIFNLFKYISTEFNDANKSEIRISYEIELHLICGINLH